QLTKQLLPPGKEVLLTSAWVDRGHYLKAAAELVEVCGGRVIGIASIRFAATPCTQVLSSRYQVHARSMPQENAPSLKSRTSNEMHLVASQRAEGSPSHSSSPPPPVAIAVARRKRPRQPSRTVQAEAGQLQVELAYPGGEEGQLAGESEHVREEDPVTLRGGDVQPEQNKRINSAAAARLKLSHRIAVYEANDPSEDRHTEVIREDIGIHLYAVFDGGSLITVN
ncbi:unnamed protein product, partial [Chrysoparadoxa australica]